MNRNVILAVVAVALAIGLFLFHRDYQYRQIHGTVTQVSLMTWDQEVDSVKDKEPVLVYFYREHDDNPTANDAQNKEVADFAWDHAGKVKVVAVNVSHIENLPVAIAHGAFRQPGFAIITGKDVITGTSGVFTTSDDLARLLNQAIEKQK